MIGIFEAVARRGSDRAGACLARSCEESERAIKETTKLTASRFQMTQHAGGSADPRSSTVEGTFTTHGEKQCARDISSVPPRGSKLSWALSFLPYPMSCACSCSGPGRRPSACHLADLQGLLSSRWALPVCLRGTQHRPAMLCEVFW